MENINTKEKGLQKYLILKNNEAKKIFQAINTRKILNTLSLNEKKVIHYMNENFDEIINIKIVNGEEIEKYASYPRLYDQLQYYRKQRSEWHSVEILLLKIKEEKRLENNKLYEQRKKEYPEFTDVLEKNNTKYNFIVSTYWYSIVRQDNKFVIDIIKKHLPIKTL